MFANVLNPTIPNVMVPGDTMVSTITAWFAGISWMGGVAPTLTATLNKRDYFGFIRTGVNTYETSGEKNWRWIEDRTLLKKYEGSEEKRNPAYKSFRKEVCDRDGWACRIADNNCDGRLEVHHILSWSKFPELRYAINNGITLCRFHHPRKRVDEMKLSPYFQSLVMSNSN